MNPILHRRCLLFVGLLLELSASLHAAPPRRDRYGDPLPPGISAGDRVRVWNADTGEELRASREFLTHCSAAVMAPDGKSLITGSREGAIVWDLSSMKALRSITTAADYPQAMALAPDGKTLIATIEHISGGMNRHQDFVRLWDVQTGKEKPSIGKGTYAPQLAISPDGSQLAGGTTYQNGSIRIWDMKVGNLSLDVKSKTSWGPGQALLCFSPDGKLLASVEQDHTIRLWDAHSGSAIRVLRGHQENIRTVVFSPDGKTLLSGGEEDTLRLWDVARGKSLYQLVGHQSAVTAAAFSRDGKRIASASEDTTILIWDVPGLAKLVRPPLPPLTEEELLCLWTDLGTVYYSMRQRAIRRFTTDPQTALAFVKKRLKPELPRDNRLMRLLDDLDSDTFAVRENASRELAAMGKSIAPALRHALSENPSAEKRWRIRALLEKMPRPQRLSGDIASEERRLLSVILLLDKMGTAEALELLRFLAYSAKLSALLTDPSTWGHEVREVKAVLARRGIQPAKP